MPAVITEGRHAAEFIVSESNGYRSREAIIVGSGADLQPGTVLAKAPGAATSAAKAGGNTGTGTFVLDATNPVLGGAKAGVYTLRCITAVTNGGTFRLEDPDGFVLGDYVIAAGAGGVVAVNDDIKGVITDGGTDFVAGDGFDITVAASTKFKQLDLTALNGLQVAAAILYGPAFAASADRRGAAYVRECEVNGGEIVWPDGITTNQKAAAIAQLAVASIIVR